MEKRKFTTSELIGIIVLAILSVAGIVCSIIGSIQRMGFLYITPGFVAKVIMFIAVAYYALIGFRKPHGNLLRAVFILMSLTCLNGVIDSSSCMRLYKGDEAKLQTVIIGLDGISILLIAYVGGRLDKIKKNIIPLVLITLAQLVKSILFITLHGSWLEPMYIIWNFSTCILWFDIAFAYILRYKEHKEAGLLDK